MSVAIELIKVIQEYAETLSWIETTDKPRRKAMGTKIARVLRVCGPHTLSRLLLRSLFSVEQAYITKGSTCKLPKVNKQPKSKAICRYFNDLLSFEHTELFSGSFVQFGKCHVESLFVPRQ